jgi:hypothetical protein
MKYNRTTKKISINWKWAFWGVAISYIITVLSFFGKL